MVGELVLTPLVPDIDDILCPMVGVVLLGVQEGLVNLDPCPVADTVAGKVVLAPVKVLDVNGILCLTAEDTTVGDTTAVGVVS